MGIFGKLFGKKSSPASINPEPVTPAAEPFTPSTPAYTPPPIYTSPILHPISHDEVEKLIADNPLSANYRKPTQQQSASINFIPIPDFYEKSKGSFVALDLETTGLNHLQDYIIEIGAVKVKNFEIVETYQQLVFPNVSIPPEASAVNNITDDMVSDMPFIFQVLPDLLYFVDRQIIVAHNAAFEFQFIGQSCMRYRFKIPHRWVDSMELKKYYPEIKSRKLESFLSAAGISNDESHRALSDAEALAKLMIYSASRVDHFGDPRRPFPPPPRPNPNAPAPRPPEKTKPQQIDNNEDLSS